jgi:hypothetical protein
VKRRRHTPEQIVRKLREMRLAHETVVQMTIAGAPLQPKDVANFAKTGQALAANALGLEPGEAQTRPPDPRPREDRDADHEGPASM